jgi:dUTP pyrophosphatase
MKINFILKDGAKLPQFATSGSSGFDIAANETKRIHPNERMLISTGLWPVLPHGYEIQIRPRSGLSLNSPLVIPNAPGTIDADYRGEIKIIIWNSGTESYLVRKGDKIAQGVVACVCAKSIVVFGELQPEQADKTERGEGGFGHTDKAAINPNTGLKYGEVMPPDAYPQ